MSEDLLPFDEPTSPARCGARLRRKDVTCRRFPLRGASRCKLHGGLQQILPHGDPRRGGRPATHRLYCRTLTPDMVETYNAVDPASLEHEIRVACANAARLQALFDAEPTRGIAVSVTGTGTANRSVQIRPYAELLAEQHDLIRKLKLAQTLLEAAKRGETKSLEAWARSWSHRGRVRKSPRSLKPVIDVQALPPGEEPRAEE